MTWSEFLDRVEIRFPLPLEVRTRANPHIQAEVELRVALTVPDIKTGELIRVYCTDFPPPLSELPDPARYLRTFLLRALAHELDETLFVDGVKAHDPHTEDVYDIPRYL